MPSGTVYIEPKDIIDPSAQGNLVTGKGVDAEGKTVAIVEKRAKEELVEALENKRDVNFMYKIVSNSVIMKFPVTLRKEVNIDKDDVKFGFNLTIDSKISST